MTISRFLWLAPSCLTILAAAGCTQDTPTGPVAGLGSSSISKYVAIGNSLTAGFQSNALYASSQQYSYPSLIAGQLMKAGGSLGTFEQPLVGDPGTADSVGGSASRLEILGFSGGLPIIGTRGLAPGTPLNSGLSRPYDNLGIPYAPLASFLDTLNAFPGPLGFFTDLVTRPGGSLPKSVFQQVVSLQPDLVTFWLGNNDVLAYATSGGISPSAPTNAGVFAAAYTQALDTLRAALPNAVILVGNIPDVTSIPFFTTIGPSLLPLGITQVYAIRSTGDTVAMPLQTNYLTLAAQGPLGAGKGLLPSNPLPNSVVLDSLEIIVAQNAVNSYNASIAAAATQSNAILFDVNALLKKVKAEHYMVAGEVYTSEYLGGLFSLDGVHPTSRGYAIVANEMLRVLNARLGSSIPLVNVSSIPGIPLSLSKGTVPQFTPDAFKDFYRLFSTGQLNF